MALKNCLAHARPDEHVGLIIVAEPVGLAGYILVRVVMQGPDKAEMKMRLVGHVLYDAGHLTKGVVLQLDGLAHDIGPVKIASGDGFVDDDGAWLVERRIRIDPGS